MHNPKVSFIVPCYKLAHFLPDCIQSILGQTFRDFEILIMDDCSPDDTPEVARSFEDPRVRYIRNDPNLGHLRNYNKGIELSRGEWIWLISADDTLRRPYILELYLQVVSDRPRIGYVFCPGVGLVDGCETSVIDTYYYGAEDRIFDGREFIQTVLRRHGGIVSPSVMVRRECYERISLFPLDLPHQGDLYLWFKWALDYDVAYLAEPMVSYRTHDLSMMKDFMSRQPRTVLSDELAVLWRTRASAMEKGLTSLARELEFFIANKYSAAVAFAIYGEGWVPWPMSIAECEAEIRSHTNADAEYRRIRAGLNLCLGDRHWSRASYAQACRCYVNALRDDWSTPKVWAKLLLALSGPVGHAFRSAISQARGSARPPAASGQNVPN